jgi:hypothetical protein
VEFMMFDVLPARPRRERFSRASHGENLSDPKRGLVEPVASCDWRN